MPDTTPFRVPTAEQVAAIAPRFWAKVNKTETCWLWTAARQSDGYGHINVRGHGAMAAHRVSWLLAGRTLNPGKVLDHLCYERHCVNPDHLREATQKQNCENIGRPAPNVGTGARGVNRDHHSKKWRVRVKHHGVTHEIGWFEDFDEANAAAIEARNRLFTHNDLDRV